MKKIKSIVINNETAIKPYFYLKNKRLHCRYTVDRCIELTDSENDRVIEELKKEPYDKQKIFKDNWIFFQNFVKKSIVDGIQVVNDFFKEVQNDVL